MYLATKINSSGAVQYQQLERSDEGHPANRRQRQGDFSHRFKEKVEIHAVTVRDNERSDLWQERFKTVQVKTVVAPAPQPKRPAPTSFSQVAKKRMRAAIDNFAGMFEAVRETEGAMFFANDKGKTYERKPVFLTLTIPRQSIDDMKIKRKALINVMQLLVRSYGVVSYIWKAEAQERGALHFHVIIDTFINHWKIRRLWFNNLNRLGCLPQGAKVEHMSRLVYVTGANDIDCLAQQLGSYLEGDKDEEGKLIHKHDSEKRVRPITGRSWGCSDNLKEKAFTVTGINEVMAKEMENNAISVFEVEGSKGKIVAKVFRHRRAFFNGKNRTPVKVTRDYTLKSYWLAYHYICAQVVYKKNRNIATLTKYLTHSEYFTLVYPPPSLS